MVHIHINSCEPVNIPPVVHNPPAAQQSHEFGQAAAVPPPTAIASAASLLNAPLPGPCSLLGPTLGRVGHPPTVASGPIPSAQGPTLGTVGHPPTDAPGPLPSAQGPTLGTVGHPPVAPLSPPLPLPLPLLALPNLNFVPHGPPQVFFPDRPNLSYIP